MFSPSFPNFKSLSFPQKENLSMMLLCSPLNISLWIFWCFHKGCQPDGWRLVFRKTKIGTFLIRGFGKTQISM